MGIVCSIAPSREEAPADWHGTELVRDMTERLRLLSLLSIASGAAADAGRLHATFDEELTFGPAAAFEHAEELAGRFSTDFGAMTVKGCKLHEPT